MPEDEDELVQRLGLTARNVRVRSLLVVISCLNVFGSAKFQLFLRT